MVNTRTSGEHLEPFKDNPEKLFHKKSDNLSEQVDKGIEGKIVLADMAIVPTLRDDVAVSIANLGHSCMVYPNPATGKSGSFEIKQNLLMRLPIFHDLPTEEPNQHLSRFLTIVENMGPDLADPQILKMKAFPFSLDGAALDWLEEFPLGYITSWEKLAQEFLQKFYPATRVMNMRSQIAGLRQNATKTYAEYYARFQKLQKICPQHGFSKGSLLHFFYQGLLEGEKIHLNSAAQGVNQGAGSDQRLSKIKENIEKLSALMLSGKTPKAQVCGICSTPGHFIDACPTSMDPSYEDVNAVGFANQGGNQFSNTYNPRWRDHPNLRYGNTSNALNGFQFQNTSTPPGFQQRGQGSQNMGGDSNIEKLMSKLVDGQMEMQKKCTTNSQDIKEIQKQLGDVIKKINQEHEPGRLPGTTHPNLKFEHVNIITTKSGRNVIPNRKVLENKVDMHRVERDPATEKASHNKKNEERDNSQAHEILHEKKNEAESEHKELEAQTSPKSTGKSFNSSNPVITNSRFDYVPFPARCAKLDIMATRIYERVDLRASQSWYHSYVRIKSCSRQISYSFSGESVGSSSDTDPSEAYMVIFSDSEDLSVQKIPAPPRAPPIVIDLTDSPLRVEDFGSPVTIVQPTDAIQTFTSLSDLTPIPSPVIPATEEIPVVLTPVRAKTRANNIHKYTRSQVI
ncbi:hypothetical protein AgCh_021362 [Apium graveolens]